MSFSFPHDKRRDGFSLVEVAISLLVLSVLAGMGLKVFSDNEYSDKLALTQKRLDQIETALLNYSHLHHRLPCPARINDPDGTQNFGFGAHGPGACEGNPSWTGTSNEHHTIILDAGFLTSTTAVGAVPYRDLDLPIDVAYDGWGRRITYAVDLDSTKLNALMSDMPFDSDLGSITVDDVAGVARTTEALYTLLSHGNNGHNAYLASGNQKDAGSTNTGELENSDADNEFVMQALTLNASDSDDTYDDLLRYKERWHFISGFESAKIADPECRRGVWTCVPRYRLPNGEWVPAFKVMRYEARKDEDLSTPISMGTGPEDDGKPWTSATFVEARTACQSLDPAGGGSPTGPHHDYDIISDNQFLSIIQQLVRVRKNWFEFGGSSYLYRGMVSGSSPDDLEPTGISRDPYFGTGNSASSASADAISTARRLYLADGQSIWDLAGHVMEYTYCDDATPGCEDGLVEDFDGLEAYADDSALPGGSPAMCYHSGCASNLTYLANSRRLNLLPPVDVSQDQYSGKFSYILGGTWPKPIRRGGTLGGNGPEHGMFQVSISEEATNIAGTGFRCVKPWIRQNK